MALKRAAGESDSEYETFSENEEEEVATELVDKTDSENYDDDDDVKHNDGDVPENESDDERDSVDSGVAETVVNKIESRKSERKIAQVDEFEFDSSDEEDLRNTVGNIPFELYDQYDHIGYDWDGNKIMKPPKGDRFDELLNKADDPYYNRTVIDRQTGQKIVLTDADIDIINRIRSNRYPDANVDPFENAIDLYSYKTELHPVTNRPDTKAQFTPSLSERRLISRYMTRLKRNWRQTKPKKPPAPKEPFTFSYDLWETDGDTNSKRYRRFIQAPKESLPGHAESYNPPPEYLFDKQEEKEWHQQDVEDRKLNFMPKKYGKLRHVPGYSRIIQERYQRCLDLYLCTRVKKMKANVNPDDLIPRLPKPRDLRPFPCVQSLIYTGHTGVVRCVDAEPDGEFIVSGGDDCTVRFWEVLTGRCVHCIRFDEPVMWLAWNPNYERKLCLVACGETVHIVSCIVGEKSLLKETSKLFTEPLSIENQPSYSAADASNSLTWKIYSPDNDRDEWNAGYRASITYKFEITQCVWHRKGDYFATLMQSGNNRSVVINQLSRRMSQYPFTKSKGIITAVSFHPSKPLFFVCTQRHVKVYNLAQQKLTKKLFANSKNVSSIAIHPGGDNLILGCLDVRLSWFDLELGDKPYRTLKYHTKSVRAVTYHPKYPLFASASDDASIIVSHGMVYSDLLKNALIVPVKVLRGHKPAHDLGVVHCVFHPKQPWIFSAGADGTVRLYTH